MMQGYCREPHPDTLVLSLPFSHTPVGLHGSLQPDVAVLPPSFSFIYRWNPGICFHVSCTLYIVSPIPQSRGDLHLTLSPDNFICSLFGTIFIVQHCHYYYYFYYICLYVFTSRSIGSLTGSLQNASKLCKQAALPFIHEKMGHEKVTLGDIIKHNSPRRGVTVYPLEHYNQTTMPCFSIGTRLWCSESFLF